MADVEIASLWLRLIGKPPEENVGRNIIYADKKKLVQALPADIIAGSKYAAITKEQVNTVLAPFRETLTAGKYIMLVRFLATGLEKGRECLSWDVAIPQIPVGMPREPARFTPDKFKELHCLRRIEKAFIQSLSSSQPLTGRQRIGQLVLSAILNGGLLDGAWVEPWIASISDRIRTHGDFCWFEMQKAWQYPRDERLDKKNYKKKSAEQQILMTRRWFADPLTRVLVVRWKSSLDPDLKNLHLLPNAYDLIVEFLKYAGVTRDGIPNSLSGLLNMAETGLSLKVPPFLASYARGGIKSVSLQPETWARLCTGKAIPRSRLQDDESDQVEEDAQKADIELADPGPLYEQEQILRKMRRIFADNYGYKKRNKELRAELADVARMHEGRFGPVLFLLMKWTDLLLAQESRYKPGTAKRYLGSIGQVLLLVFENDDLLKMEVGDFIERYNRAIELIRSKTEKNYAKPRIGHFHNYLVRGYGVPQIPPGYFQGRSGPPETTVDANLVTPAEFDLLKNMLGWENPKRPPVATAALIAAILGFRCGLRRDEVYYIRVQDLQKGQKPELVLRATARRSLKTPSSTRRLPLHVLVMDDEMSLIYSWLDGIENPSNETLLFTDPTNSQKLLRETAIFDPITYGLAAVTGDATLRFHHLRHSFANWLLVRLVGNSAGLRGSAPFLDHPLFSDHRIIELRNALLGNENLGRKAIYAVSLLLGHGEISSTLTSYLHLCDWLLSRELFQSVATQTYEIETIMGITGLSQPSIYRLSRKAGTGGFIWDWEAHFKGLTKKSSGLTDPLQAFAREPIAVEIKFADKPKAVPVWETIEQVLKLHRSNKLSVEEIANKLELEDKTVLQWILSSERVLHLTTREAKPKTFDFNGNLVWRGTGANPRHTGQTKIYIPKSKKLAKNPKEENDELLSVTATGSPDDKIPEEAKAQPKRRPSNPKYRNRRSGDNTVHKDRFPHIPMHDDELALADSILTTFQKLDDDKKREILDQVDYFLYSFARTGRMLHFWEASKALKYIDVLQNLGVSPETIQLVYFPYEKEDPAITEQRKSEWEEILGLKNCWWVTGNQKYGRRSGIGTIGIQVIRNRKVKSKGTMASYGLRYAFYLIAIMHNVG
ncbi:hypothetical protein KI809_17600 [Geobacter pelophilus]|uniref:Tyr recombinase domain-containing protein n=1 Tax=Geoanaerobacter pelophilus TaxID=60036 RepID=A0AAW4LDP1_9BACT|nr:hypothetical protein [Geoanaerobacter pelophilus]MBT0666129.1 hypothetical protein [Geoanaerobacter pelophilus]